MTDRFSGPRRRDLLGSTALLFAGGRALAAATGSIVAGCGGDRSALPGLTGAQREAARVAAAYLGADSGEGAVALGNAYLAQVAPDLDRHIIDADLTGVTSLVAGSPGEPAALAAVEEAVVDDFRSGAMVTLSGWSLGRTELRLCALLALSEGD
jgi:hypothetical protein